MSSSYFMSDIHSNYRAVSAVCADMAASGFLEASCNAAWQVPKTSLPIRTPWNDAAVLSVEHR